MERLRRQYDTLHKVDLSTVEDIHTVAGLLKLYLRLLPQQLVPFSIYRSLLSAYINNRAFHERSKMCRYIADVFLLKSLGNLTCPAREYGLVKR